MCGRFSLSVPVSVIRSHITHSSHRPTQHGQIQHMVDYPDLDVAEADWIDQDEFVPRFEHLLFRVFLDSNNMVYRYNIAPRSNAPVIRRQNPDRNELVIHTMVSTNRRPPCS